jgi:protein ImuA
MMTHPALKTLPLRPAKAADSSLAPAWAAQLEEVAAAHAPDWGAAFAFALDRITTRPDPRPLALVGAKAWLNERGRPYARGLERLGAQADRLLMIVVDREAQALWALEEVLKSGAVCGAIGTLEQTPFVAGRRLDFAAREGRAMGVLLRAKAVEDLSAARVRWRISAAPSAADPYDDKAPGPMRMTAEVVRRRDGPPAVFEWEESDAQDTAAPRLRLAPRLAGDGLVEAGRTPFAA